MGKAKEHKEMLFWTRRNTRNFPKMMDKPVSFMPLKCSTGAVSGRASCWRLTPADFDFDKETVTINKSYQRLQGKDVITTPKTKKSNRTIKMPKFLCEEMQDYLGTTLRNRRRKTVSLK